MKTATEGFPFVCAHNWNLYYYIIIIKHPIILTERVANRKPKLFTNIYNNRSKEDARWRIKTTCFSICTQLRHLKLPRNPHQLWYNLLIRIGMAIFRGPSKQPCWLRECPLLQASIQLGYDTICVQKMCHKAKQNLTKSCSNP